MQVIIFSFASFTSLAQYLVLCVFIFCQFYRESLSAESLLQNRFSPYQISNKMHPSNKCNKRWPHISLSLTPSLALSLYLPVVMCFVCVCERVLVFNIDNNK